MNKMKNLKNSANARTLFNSIVKGKNFMTPNTLGHYKIKNGAVEVSEGTGFTGDKIYGVTVVLHNKHAHELSKCLYSIEEVEKYIETLK